MHAINYKFIRLWNEIRQEEGLGREARFSVLLNLWSHANNRNRAWVNFDTISKETGFTNRTAISEAFTYWQERGAIYNVPHEFRVGNESTHKQLRVWQLTGVAYLDGKWEQYLILNADHIPATIAEATEMGIENIVTAFLDAENYGETLTSDLKLLVSEQPVTLSDQTSDLKLPEEKENSSKRNISLVAPSATDEPAARFDLLDQMDQAGIDVMTAPKNAVVYDDKGHSELVKHLYDNHRKQLNKAQLKQLDTNKTFFLEGGEWRGGSPNDLFVTDIRFPMYVDDMIAACKRMNKGQLPWLILIGMICKFDRVSPGQHGWIEWQKSVPLAPDGTPEEKKVRGIVIDNPDFVPEGFEG